MSEAEKSGPSVDEVERAMRGELAHGDVIIATARPILRHLLANDDHALFSDEVIARVRGMMVHVARQLLFALAGQKDVEDRNGFVDGREEDLALAFLEQGDLLGHAHALTIEAQIANRLSHRSGIDPVLSPLLQELVAASDEEIAVQAMRVLSAQARFMQQIRRMEFPLYELPQAHFDQALAIFLEEAGEGNEAAAAVVANLHDGYDPEQRRIGQILRLVSAMQQKAKRALEIDHAGVAIFATALAMASDQRRDTMILALGERQTARLALSLRAAGMGQKAVEDQFLYLHPDLELPAGFDRIVTDRAAAILADFEEEVGG